MMVGFSFSKLCHTSTFQAKPVGVHLVEQRKKNESRPSFFVLLIRSTPHGISVDPNSTGHNQLFYLTMVQL